MSIDRDQVPPSTPDKLLLEEVEELSSLMPSERADRIRAFGARVAGGADDSGVVHRMVELARENLEWGLRDVWLSYFSASASELQFPVLEAWLEDPDEDRRKEIIGVLAWNRSAMVNDALLHVIRSDKSERVRKLALKHLVRRGTLGKWNPCDLLSVVRESDWRPVTKREYLTLMANTAKKTGGKPAT